MLRVRSETIHESPQMEWQVGRLAVVFFGECQWQSGVFHADLPLITPAITNVPQSRKRDKQEISWSAVDSGGTKPDGRGRDARSGGQRKPRLGTATPVTDRNLERPRDRVRGPWAPAVGRGAHLPQRSPPSSGPMPLSAELTWLASCVMNAPSTPANLGLSPNVSRPGRNGWHQPPRGASVNHRGNWRATQSSLGI